MFLFKLHSPNDYIVGGGFFVRSSILPTYLAWEAFGRSNGTNSLKELTDRIIKYRGKNGIGQENPQIGCVILTEPFWFDEKDWIDVPSNWSKSIVQGKTYCTDESAGHELYCAVIERLKRSKHNEKVQYEVEKKERMDDILVAIKNKDKEALKEMFSEKVQDEADLDTNIDMLFDFIDGEIIAARCEIGGGEESIEDGGRSILENSYYLIVTKTEKYVFYVDDYIINTLDPENEGLYLVVVMRESDEDIVYDENGRYMYDDEGEKIDHKGIYIPIP